MKKNILLILMVAQLAFVAKLHSQNIAINGTGSLPDTSAMLDVSSLNKGFLAPRMSSNQRSSIPLPANGLLVYNTTDKAFNVNTGTPAAPVWVALSSGTPGISTGTGWSTTGNSSTNPSINYIGTSDAQALVFKVKGIQAGYLGLPGESDATSFGINASANYRSTAIGSGAMATAGNEATAIGYNSGATFQSVAIGSGATSTANNEAVAVGIKSSAGGYRSVAIGSGAKASNSNDIIAIGTNSYGNSYQGIAIGAGAGTSTNNGAIAIGVGTTANGYQTTALGNGANTTGQNTTAIGNGASATSDNTISIGNSSIQVIRAAVGITTYSDGRFKRNIKADVPGLDFIMQLRPVTYNWDIHKFNAYTRIGNAATTAGKNKTTDKLEEAGITKKESITYTGFIAQEVEKAAQASNYNFSGVLKPLNDKDAYSLNYAEFVVPLVKAAQELNKKNEALTSRIDAQQKLIDKLIAEVELLKAKTK